MGAVRYDCTDDNINDGPPTNVSIRTVNGCSVAP